MALHQTHDSIKDRIRHNVNRHLSLDKVGSPVSFSADDTVIEKEHHIKDVGRYADLGLQTPDGDIAFEVKTSCQDFKRYPDQAKDYRLAGYIPVLVGTYEIFDEISDSDKLPEVYYVLATRRQMVFIDEYPDLLGPLAQSHHWRCLSRDEVNREDHDDFDLQLLSLPTGVDFYPV